MSKTVVHDLLLYVLHKRLNQQGRLIEDQREDAATDFNRLALPFYEHLSPAPEGCWVGVI